MAKLDGPAAQQEQVRARIRARLLCPPARAVLAWAVSDL